MKTTAAEAHEGDRALAARLDRGDRSAFDALLVRHGAVLYRYAWGMTDQRADAEDHVQDVFLQLWRQRHTVQNSIAGESLLPWLLTVCKHTVYNANRRGRRVRTEPLPEVEHLGERVDDHGVDELRFVRDEIARLAPVDRELVRRCVMNGESYISAAASLDLNPAAARKRVQRIRARLQAARLAQK